MYIHFKHYSKDNNSIWLVAFNRRWRNKDLQMTSIKYSSIKCFFAWNHVQEEVCQQWWLWMLRQLVLPQSVITVLKFPLGPSHRCGNRDLGHLLFHLRLPQQEKLWWNRPRKESTITRLILWDDNWLWRVTVLSDQCWGPIPGRITAVQ